MDEGIDADDAYLLPTARGRWAYDWSHRRHPMVHPLRSPAGDVLTVDGPADHPWHHALWFAIKFVNGENFWEEYDAYGVTRHVAPPEVTASSVTGRLEWIRPDRSTVVLRERRRLVHVPIDDDTYAIDWDIELVAAVDVLLDRTPFDHWGGYGGLTLRGRPDWHDTRLTGPDGDHGLRALGVRAPWCDLTGEVAETGRSAGVLVLDHPDNPSYPTPWYATTRSSAYGDEGWSNFLCAAFLWDGPQTVGAGEALSVRHRVIVHDGTWLAARCQHEHERWVAHGALREESGTFVSPST